MAARMPEGSAHQCLVGGEPALELELESDIVQSFFGQDMKRVRRVRCLNDHIYLATESTSPGPRVPCCSPGPKTCKHQHTS